MLSNQVGSNRTIRSVGKELLLQEKVRVITDCFASNLEVIQLHNTMDSDANSKDMTDPVQKIFYTILTNKFWSYGTRAQLHIATFNSLANTLNVQKTQSVWISSD